MIILNGVERLEEVKRLEGIRKLEKKIIFVFVSVLKNKKDYFYSYLLLKSQKNCLSKEYSQKEYSQFANASPPAIKHKPSIFEVIGEG
jgi:hypothetical protein